MRPIMKNNVFAMITVSIFGVGATTSSALADEKILIKGLSASSTVAEIEAVFGPCGDPDENGWHYCGGSDINAYKEVQGPIKDIYFSCEIMNACDYPVEVLAQIIKEERSAISAVDTNDWEYGTIITLHGNSGDFLKLQSFQDDGKNSFISLSANPQLNLD